MNRSFFYTDNLSVGYNGKPLIREICLQLKKGEILTLIGPNGSGKSTILKSIARQLSPICGTVYLENQNMSRLSDKDLARKMSVMLTERIQPELYTCEDIVAAGRYPYTGMLGILSEQDRAKVREAMETADVWALRFHDFSSLSDGQRQRVLLARALCQEPELLLLDEPTSFLDIHHKLELLSILKRFVLSKGLTVILSLHELDLAQKLSDRVISIRGDQIDRCGTPEEIFTSDYIRTLYGIEQGSYNAAFGCVEMEPVKGQPEVFVIGGNGSGIPLYRNLQRQGIPFAAGILHKNDIDYQVAVQLSETVITEEPFETITQEHFLQALSVMKTCRSVCCPLDTFGTMNKKNEELRRAAESLGILTVFQFPS